MHKIGLVIRREFLSRVRKKSFIIMTILGPLLFAAMMVLPVWLASQGGDEKAVRVIDEEGLFEKTFTESTDQNYDYSREGDLETAKQELLEGTYDVLLYIPPLELDSPSDIALYSTGNPSFSVVNSVKWKLETELENEKLRKSGLSKKVIDDLQVEVGINTINLTATGDEKESSSAGATAIGYIAAFMVYMFIFIYGAMCMRGVIEEKNSRIIEVIISSVKPFQLMMGKVIGIASVGLMQFILWVVLSFGISSAVGAFLFNGNETGGTEMPSMQVGANQDAGFVYEALHAVSSVNIPLVIFCFLFFFIGGYLLYGALFAAVGSAVDSDADAQQFMLPVTIPLILSIVSLGAIINDPNSTLAFWLSVIPLSSPVVMMMRVPFGIPEWQLALSMAMLVGGFMFTIWMAGRIYRVGILMHGTKVNYKVLARWFMTRN